MGRWDELEGMVWYVMMLLVNRKKMRLVRMGEIELVMNVFEDGGVGDEGGGI